jgi:hypothetical protein
MNKTLARLLSLVFHPLLMPTYALLLLLTINPYAFSVRHAADKPAVILLISVFSTSFILPATGAVLMRLLGLIKSLRMDDKMERTGPYILTGVFYLWLYKNLLSGGHTPPLYTTFVLGATIGLFLAFFINIFTKISAHAVGMGGLFALLLLVNHAWGGAVIDVPAFGGNLQLSLNALLAIVAVTAGVVGTARLALQAHLPADLYRGYAAGVFAVLLAGMIG